jgi:glucose-1-phosphate cytidylyltransferase
MASKLLKFGEKLKAVISAGGLGNGFSEDVFSHPKPKVIDYITDDKTIWECEPPDYLAEGAELAAFLHYGFGQCMGILRDKIALEELRRTGKVPWKAWR